MHNYYIIKDYLSNAPLNLINSKNKNISYYSDINNSTNDTNSKDDTIHDDIRPNELGYSSMIINDYLEWSLIYSTNTTNLLNKFFNLVNYYGRAFQ